EVDVLDISFIRDTRTGKYAKIPKDPKMREILGFENSGSPQERKPEDKLVTVIHGPDVVNITFLNFMAVQEDTAKIWTEELFKLATNILAQNVSRNTFLQKVYIRLKLQVNQDNRIPVKNIINMFSMEKKRVESALEMCGLSFKKNEAIKPDEFTLEIFQQFLRKLCPRQDIDNLVAELGAGIKPYITLEQLRGFVNHKQRDTRLNEILYPPLRDYQIRQLIEKYEPNKSFAENVDRMSLDGFCQYLSGEENSIIPSEILDVSDDMTQPLSSYFINSSHNTYLTAGQLTGVSSVEVYRQVLLTGCRCIELDCWPGRLPEEEPFITHGFTMTTEIPFKEVIEAIAESAFKTSPYPVILSFENHVASSKQQAKMAEYCRTIFGDALLIDPLEKYPLVPGQPLPSPQELMGKILIKNKKRHHPKVLEGSVKRRLVEQSSFSETFSLLEQSSPSLGSPLHDPTELTSNGEERLLEKAQKDMEPRKSFGKTRLGCTARERVRLLHNHRHDREAESDEDEEDDQQELKKPTTDEGTASSEVNATEEMSNLVNYIEPVKFKSFDVANKRNKYFEMSSFVETKGLEQLTKSPMDFLAYNKKQLSRIYPKGTRVDSSNYMPQVFWNVGCQMVALNFQTLDLPMQLNMGVFDYNGRSGYILKPEFMRRMDKQFDPFTESIVDGIVANKLTVKFNSNQLLKPLQVRTSLIILFHWLDCKVYRKFLPINSSPGNFSTAVGLCVFSLPRSCLYYVWLMLNLSFQTPNLYTGVCHVFLLLAAVWLNFIREGYHYISLKNESNQSLMLPALLVYTEASDYIPDAHQACVRACVMPIDWFHIVLFSQQLENIEKLDDDPKPAQKSSPQIVPPLQKSPAPTELPKFPFFPPPTPSPEKTPKINPCVAFPLQREDLIASVLADVQPQSVEDLKLQKACVKLQKKHYQELKELKKKHMKKISSLNKEQRSRINEFNIESVRRRSQVDIKKELSALEAEVSQKNVELKEWQMQELLEMREKQYKAEKEKKCEHLKQELQKLKEVAMDCQASQLKRLKDQNEKEKKELQKILDRKRHNSITEIKSREKQKGSMVVLAEINTRHIKESVSSIRQLEAAQKKRHERLSLKHGEILQQIEEEELRLQATLEKQCEVEFQTLNQEIRRFLQEEMDGKTEGSNCNNGHFNTNSPVLGTSSAHSTPSSRDKLGRLGKSSFTEDGSVVSGPSSLLISEGDSTDL
uniref:1-phosphatidylinositol 4,5-bisphosphate phosphodiesterase n=1 Tax=Latimeria chalumnae TaxID=7897 RepID=H3AZ25_LATCH